MDLDNLNFVGMLYVSYHNIESVSFSDFGAKGDGVHDDTIACQRALDYCAEQKISLIEIRGGNTYLVNKLIVSSGVKSFICKSRIVGSGNSAPYLVNLLSRQRSIDGSCNVSVNVDLSNGDTIAIGGKDVSGYIIEDCTVSGFNRKGTQYGILLQGESNNNVIRYNRVIGMERAVSKQILVGIFGDGVSYGQFYERRRSNKFGRYAFSNHIYGNVLEFGTHAIDLLTARDTLVENNQCVKNRNRAIYCGNNTTASIIRNNSLVGFGSSAVLLAYGSFGNYVIDNICRQIKDYNGVAGEAAINVNTWSYKNTIKGNSIDSFTHYGIYLAVDVCENLIESNTICNYYLAGIAIENDWEDTPPVLAKFSRPNFGPPAHRERWASGDSFNNKVVNNIIHDGYKGRITTAIYIAQLGNDFKTRDNKVVRNIIILEDFRSYSYYFYENRKGYNLNTIWRNNSVREKSLTFSNCFIVTTL